jgi:hypothetical protein
MFYIGWDGEYLAVIGLPLFKKKLKFYGSRGFHSAHHALYLPKLPNTMVGELGRCKLRVDYKRKII